MGPFTLYVVLQVGLGFQRIETPNLSESECKAKARKAALGASGLFRSPQPQICAFAACWQGGRRIS